MKIYNSIIELIGKTPLVNIKKYSKINDVRGNLIVKVEFMNPAGSVKDRIGLEMIKDAEERGLINENTTIIEPTSGNTGIGLACVAAAKGYKVILTMPDTMSEERKKLLKAYGAELILTDGTKGMGGAIEKAKELLNDIENSIMPSQFTNIANVNAHKKTTGPEIWEDTDGKVDVFVAGVGTGGTITGVGEYLKSKNKEIKIIAIEPTESPVISGGKAGQHALQGLGAGFIPEILNVKIIDEVVKVEKENAYQKVKEILKTEGMLVGISAGATLYTATEIAKRPEYEGKNIVVLIPDSGERYLSLDLFN